MMRKRTNKRILGVHAHMPHHTVGRKDPMSPMEEESFLLNESQSVAGIGSYVFDVIAGTWRSSDELDRIFGIGKKHPKTVAGWLKIIHPEERKMMGAYLVNEVLGKKKRFDKTYRIIRKRDGKTRWVHGLGKLKMDQQGKAVQMVGTIQDITEERSIRGSLIDSEEKFRVLSERSLVSIYLIQDGVLQYVNPNFAKLFGYRREEIIGKLGPKTFVTPHDWPIVIKKINQRLSGEIQTAHYIFHGRKKNGRIRTIEVLGSRIIYRGRPAVIGSMIDITEQESREDELQQKNEELQKFRLAAEGVSDVVVMTDPSGRIVFANDAAVRQMGYDRKEMLGKKPWQLWLKNMNPALMQEVVRRLQTQKKPYLGEYENTKKNGETYISRTSTSPILDKQGNVLFLVSIGRNITKEKEVEQMKSEFVSVASHQMRTPLTGIKWMTDFLLDEKNGRLTAEQKGIAAKIRESNERMIRLVNDLLDVSHIESGLKFSIQKKKCDLASILKQTVDEASAKALKKQIRLTIPSATAKHLHVRADREKIRQVFQNLLSNAINYSFPDTRITASCRRKNGAVVCSVRDSGIGISKELQPRIFEKFFRADNAMHTEVDGTGLGLYIAKAIVEGHGGRIWFKSKIRRGTTFTFSIPLI